MINIHSIFQQYLCHFQPSLFSSPVEWILVVGINLIEIIVVRLQQSFDDLSLAWIMQILPSLAKKKIMVCLMSSFTRGLAPLSIKKLIIAKQFY
jgi:hypothetical protein